MQWAAPSDGLPLQRSHARPPARRTLRQAQVDVRRGERVDVEPDVVRQRVLYQVLVLVLVLALCGVGEAEGGGGGAAGSRTAAPAAGGGGAAAATAAQRPAPCTAESPPCRGRTPWAGRRTSCPPAQREVMTRGAQWAASLAVPVAQAPQHHHQLTIGCLHEVPAHPATRWRGPARASRRFSPENAPWPPQRRWPPHPCIAPTLQAWRGTGGRPPPRCCSVSTGWRRSPAWRRCCCGWQRLLPRRRGWGRGWCRMGTPPRTRRSCAARGACCAPARRPCAAAFRCSRPAPRSR